MRGCRLRQHASTPLPPPSTTRSCAPGADGAAPSGGVRGERADGRTLRGHRPRRAHHARSPRARQRHHARQCRASSPRCVERANLDPAVHVIAARGQRQGLLRRLRSRRERRAYRRRAAREADGPPGSPIDPAVIARNHDPHAHVGSDGRLRDDEPQRARLHEPVPLDKPVVCKVHGFCVAGGTDMALCSRSAGHRGQRQDRLSAGARLGRADHRAVGPPHRRAARQAPAVHRRLPVGHRGGRVGARRSRRRRRPSSTRAPRSCSSASRAMPVNQLMMMKLLVNQSLYAQGLHADADPRHRLRRHRAPHARGLCVPTARRRGRLQRGRARARRAVRRLRPFDVQGLSGMCAKVGAWRCSASAPRSAASCARAFPVAAVPRALLGRRQRARRPSRRRADVLRATRPRRSRTSCARPATLGLGRAYVDGSLAVDDLDAAFIVVDDWEPPALSARRSRAPRASRSRPPRRPGGIPRRPEPRADPARRAATASSATRRRSATTTTSATSSSRCSSTSR